VTGRTNAGLDGNTFFGDTDAFLTKLSSNGDKEWTKQWGTYGYDVGFSVAVNTVGEIFVTGSTEVALEDNVNAGGVDVFIYQFNSDGSKKSIKQWGSDANDGGVSLAVGNDGSIYVAGETMGNLDGNTNVGLDDNFLTKWIFSDTP
jgi:hypothetical protein